MSDQSGAAARPWFVVAPPFNEGAPWINAGSPDPHGGEFVCDLAWPHDEKPEDVERTEANAALIVAAVNEREVLLALEQDVKELLEGRYFTGVVAAKFRARFDDISEARRA